MYYDTGTRFKEFLGNNMNRVTLFPIKRIG